MPQGIDAIFLAIVLIIKIAVPVGFVIGLLALIAWVIKPPTMR